MENPNDLRDEPKDVVHDTQMQTAIFVASDCDLRNRLLRSRSISKKLTVGEVVAWCREKEMLKKFSEMLGV